MRIKRLKQYRKYANLFKMNHGFESPYKFLVDGSFLQMAVKTNTKLKESFGRVFQDTVHCVITRCIISELESMGPAVQKAVNTTKTFTIEECNHSDTLPADECIKSLIGDRNIYFDKGKYILCTLDFDLQYEIVQRAIVPVFYFKQMALVMAAPSDFIKYKIALKKELNQELNPTEKQFIRENIQEIQKLKAKDAKEEKKKKYEEE